MGGPRRRPAAAAALVAAALVAATLVAARGATPQAGLRSRAGAIRPLSASSTAPARIPSPRRSPPGRPGGGLAAAIAGLVVAGLLAALGTAATLARRQRPPGPDAPDAQGRPPGPDAPGGGGP